MATTDLIVDIDELTGELISGWPRAKQSIRRILTTRLHTRIMRRWWGSRFLDLLDQPSNEATFQQALGAACVAINLYEPEFRVTRLAVRGPVISGVVEITVEGVYLPDLQAKKANFIL